VTQELFFILLVWIASRWSARMLATLPDHLLSSERSGRYCRGWACKPYII